MTQELQGIVAPPLTPESKITTHTLGKMGKRGNEWFTASIDGYPLLGDNGNPSRYQSRKEAREAAQRRLIEHLERDE